MSGTVMKVTTKSIVIACKELQNILITINDNIMKTVLCICPIW